MKGSLYAALRPVRNRQRTAFLIRTGFGGLILGSIVAIVISGGRFVFGWPLDPLAVASGILLGALLGAAAGWLWRRPWREAAAAVDSHFRLKDRALTALEFLERTDRAELHDLQIADAVDHLQRLQMNKVAPIKAPRRLAAAAFVSLAAAVLIAFWPAPQSRTEAALLPAPDNIVAAAEKLQQSLQELEDVANREDAKDLKDLVADLKKKAEEMKEPGVDERQALAKLSEMQAAVQALAAELNSAVIDGQMQSLGSALASANAFEGAGRALQDVKLEKAAQELEKIDEVQLERKEAKALEEKLRQVAKDAGGAGMGSLGAAVSELADSVKGGKSKAKHASKVLAKEVSNQAKRRKLNDLLRGELDELKECKCDCQCNSLVTGKKPQKSTTPSSSFGMTESGNIQGEKTKLLSQRNQMELTGTPTDGPSDVETASSPEARQQASRGYQEKYKKFRKESEAVLETEPIPLGQRLVIRRYFELIRPQTSEPTERRADSASN
jgi:hypothetical protein